MTECNYCTLQSIKLRAHRTGLKVTTLGGERTNVFVYVHPREVDITQLSDADRERYFQSWLMEIPFQCVC